MIYTAVIHQTEQQVEMARKPRYKCFDMAPGALLYVGVGIKLRLQDVTLTGSALTTKRGCALMAGRTVVRGALHLAALTVRTERVVVKAMVMLLAN